MTDDEICFIAAECGFGKYVTTLLDDDQWERLEPKLYEFARAIESAALAKRSPFWRGNGQK